MPSYRCTECGSRMEAAPGEKICKCPSCGGLFILPNQFAQKENLYRLASEARFAGNFDLALNYYSRILKVDAMETEAYWGFLLSKYGIEISRDPLTMNQVVFHRVEHTLFMEDPSYQKMIDYCPREARYYYEGLSRRIQEAQRTLLEISRKIGAFDIYVNCVDDGNQQDMVLACQTAKALYDAGYRVFLSCILPEKMPDLPLSGEKEQRLYSRSTGEERSLYEMAAAEKSTAMLVIVTGSTNVENSRFQASWKRFLAYCRKDAGRKLLSVCQGIKPEQLPYELRPYQSLVYQGADFQGRLLGEINAMFGRQNRDQALTREILDHLRQGEEALQKASYEEAARHFEQVRSLDAEEGEAHWGLVRAATKNLTVPVLDEALDTDFQRTLQFSPSPKREERQKAVSTLMQDAAWKALEKATSGFSDTAAANTGRVDAAVSRVRLYLPKGDVRFNRLEAYFKKAEMERGAEELLKRYQEKDTAAQPLFAEQIKEENNYAGTRIQRGGFLRAGKSLCRLTAFCLCFLLAAQFFLVLHAQEGTAKGLYYHASKLCFLAGTVMLACWLFRLLRACWRNFEEQKTAALIACGVVFLLPQFLAGRFPRVITLFLPVVPAFAYLVQHLVLMLSNHSLKEGLGRREKAKKKLEAVDAAILAAYESDMRNHYAQYGEPDHPLPPYQVTHSEGFRLSTSDPKPRNGLVSFWGLVLFYGIAIGAVTLLSNLVYASGWKDIVAVESVLTYVVGLREDGTVVANGQNDYGQTSVSDWKNVVQIASGANFSAGLTEDGRVLVAAAQDSVFKEAESWTDIVEISASNVHLMGLCSDGTVVVAGSNKNNACDVEDFRDVVKIHAFNDGSGGYSAAITKEGKVLCTSNEAWQSMVDAVYDLTGSGEEQYKVIDMYGRYESQALVCEDGSILGFGNNGYYQFDNISDWDAGDLNDLFVGNYVLGLQKDGTLRMSGNNLNVSNQIQEEEGIVGMSGRYGHVLLLHEDGTVSAVGSNDEGQCDTQDWTDIAAVFAGNKASYGVRQDGRVVAAGSQRCGMTYLAPKSPLGVLAFWWDSLTW